MSQDDQLIAKAAADTAVEYLKERDGLLGKIKELEALLEKAPSFRVGQATEIVSKLAEDDPFDHDSENEAVCHFCRLPWNDPEPLPSEHKPDCLWRRARELTSRKSV